MKEYAFLPRSLPLIHKHEGKYVCRPGWPQEKNTWQKAQ